MKKVELLAPAGTIESLYAAINKGADAIYMGGSKFSARAYASNFTNEELKKAVDYAHIYGVKIFIALNTLIKEKELQDAKEYIRFLYSIGVDALIIQDFGIAKFVRENYEDFEIHSSTQMTIHNGEGAKFLKDRGFSRIVLSRELTLKEIEYISKNLNIETEIFIHGALCICYSGQCLMSSIIGGRSGNRGRCAQPCRMPYELINLENGFKEKSYILSPKDICNIDNIGELIDSGTASLKIEGRMKRPEYVAGVVDSYRKAINLYYKKEKSLMKIEQKVLLQLFNREGFSKAYLYGNKGRDMMSYNFPKNMGTYLGRILKDGTIILAEDVSVGDGIRAGDKGFTVSKIINNNIAVDKGEKGEQVYLYPQNYTKHDELYKTLDSNLMSSYNLDCKAFYKKNLLKCIVNFKIDEEISLKVNYKNKEFFVKGDKVEKAKTKAITKERIIEALSKSGDTSFKFEDINFFNYEEGFISISSLNALRRDAISEIENYILQGYRRIKHDNKKVVENNFNNKEQLPTYMVTVSTEDQLRAVKESNIKDVIFDIFSRGKNSIKEDHIKNNDQIKIYLKIPNIIKEEFNYIVDIIEKNLPYIQGISTANLGIVNIFQGRTRIIGDYKLNIYNSQGIEFFYNILDGINLSIELNKREINEVMKNTKNQCVQYLVYGKPELMISEYCPVGSIIGGKDSNNGCNNQCEKGNYILKDRKGENFIIRNDKFCRTSIYNGVSINNIDNIRELQKIGVNSFRLDFVDEDYGKTREVLQYLLKGNINLNKENYTKGHYKRGVE